jgi:hypothetical protein
MGPSKVLRAFYLGRMHGLLGTICRSGAICLSISFWACILLPAPTWAADNENSVSSSIGSNARYEIVQSELVAKATFRLDRVCGNVSQMVDAVNGQNVWHNIPILDKPPCTADGRIRFQLFSSKFTVKYTYLINTDNGNTWQLRSDSQENLVWQKLP